MKGCEIPKILVTEAVKAAMCLPVCLLLLIKFEMWCLNNYLCQGFCAPGAEVSLLLNRLWMTMSPLLAAVQTVVYIYIQSDFCVVFFRNGILQAMNLYRQNYCLLPIPPSPLK